MKENISFLATAIGSFPHKNIEEAIECVFANIPQMPVCPQLSNYCANEDMLVQYTENFPGVIKENLKNIAATQSDEFFEKLEEFYADYETIVNEKELDLLEKYAISRDYYSSMELFLQKVKETKPPFVKGQIIGPFTLGTSLLDEEKRCCFYDETFRDILVKTLTLKALWQVNEFRKANPDTQPVIFIDEPTMSQFATSAYITVSKEDIISVISEIVNVLKEFDVIAGIHCCGKTDWAMVLNCGVDIINFDAYFYSQNFSLFSKDLEKFLHKGGIIAWGVVPSLDVEALKNAKSEDLIAIYENAKDLLVNKGISEEKILKASIFTPSCGTGSLSVENAQKVMEYLRHLSEHFRNKYEEKF
ncbi:MAG: hypothetical protein PHX18_03410 [Candidatus Gastranaerophilales bacterium]|nr:hypothetical protein [Candidatus Gastranaerophilales bacterium]